MRMKIFSINPRAYVFSKGFYRGVRNTTGYIHGSLKGAVIRYNILCSLSREKILLQVVGTSCWHDLYIARVTPTRANELLFFELHGKLKRFLLSAANSFKLHNKKYV